MNHKSTIIKRFFLLVIVGTIVILGAVFFIDRGLEGTITGWFEDKLMAVYGYTTTASGEMIYIWRPNWTMVRLYGILFLLILVLIGSIAVLIVSRFFTKADLRDRMNDLGEMIHCYMFTDNDAANVFPKEYNSIAIQMSEVKSKMQRHEQLLQEEAARKNDLITYLAHDLKTPLTSVIGYLSLLSEAPDMPLEQRAKYTNIAFEKAQRLESLINEFFDITRFNLQQVHLDAAPLDLTYMLVQMTDEFFPLAHQHGNTIVLDTPDDLTIVGDANKLARVFNNILKNAIAYSDPDSEIRIKAWQNNTHTILCFTNTGPTIPPENIELLFEKFFRLDSSRSTKTGGAGLGLAIAREIITLHHGTISAESKNHQTTFTVTLPKNSPLTLPMSDKNTDIQ